MDATPKNSGLIGKIAIGIIAFSFLLFGMIFLVPFLPLSLSYKAMIASGLWGSSEITLLLGTMLAGKEIMQKFKQHLKPVFIYRYLKSKLRK